MKCPQRSSFRHIMKVSLGFTSAIACLASATSGTSPSGRKRHLTTAYSFIRQREKMRVSIPYHNGQWFSMTENESDSAGIGESEDNAPPALRRLRQWSVEVKPDARP